MMKEIRIYYECLEQAAHFIKPILEQTKSYKNNRYEVKLIKLTGNYTLYSKFVAPIIYLKDPDILITIIENGVEYPLFQLEISTAVFTEDHELQRFDGIVAAAENNCIYGKLSPIHKVSQSAHGGNTNFNFLSSYKVAFDVFGRYSYHFDWPCDKNGNVIVDDNYLSCPKEIKSLKLFLQILLKFVTDGEINYSNWIQNFEDIIFAEKTFSDWKEKLNRFVLQDIKVQNTSRTEWKTDKKELHLKINRFGHAMDPERGMLAYYGSICKNTISKMIFDPHNTAWYKDTTKESEITAFIKSNGLVTASDYMHCFLLGSAMINNKNFLSEIKNIRTRKTKNIEVDLSKFLLRNFNTLNKSLRTIFKFSKQFHIIDTEGEVRIKFVWAEFIFDNNFVKYPPITHIRSRTVFDEDDITYISVHNVLMANGYKIIAVSYPGAQGDRVVLAEAGTGRRQQRRYIDIVSYLPNSHSSLQENKGKYSGTAIQNEVDELAKYKSDLAYKKSIVNFVSRFDKSAPKIFKIGVGFWANIKFSIHHIQRLEIDKLDYFIYINSEQTKWRVFCTGSSKLFTVFEGNVDIPKVYEVTIKDDCYSFFDSKY